MTVQSDVLRAHSGSQGDLVLRCSHPAGTPYVEGGSLRRIKGGKALCNGLIKAENGGNIMILGEAPHL